jgi:hypothetical protein
MALLLGACGPRKEPAVATPPFDAAFVRLSPVEAATLPLARSFEMPMGGEQGALVYNAQPFRVTRHLGDDLNGVGGWNSDLGDPVYASGDGRVIYSGIPGPGWGNMIIMAHRVPEPEAAHGWRVYETVYAHLETRLAQAGEVVRRGAKIGRVGTANGRYLAHLHFEVRRSRSVYPGMGYADAPLDRVSPEEFLKGHPVGAADGVLLPAAPDPEAQAAQLRDVSGR